MDTELLVEGWVEDGRALLNQLAKDGFTTTAAFWVKLAERESRVLYIAADVPPGMTSSHVYVAFYPSLVKLPNYVRMDSQVKLIATTDPIAQAVIDIRDGFAGRVAVRYRGERLGPLAIEEVYIYPGGSGGAMSRTEILNTVMGLMYTTGPIKPSLITLASGSKFSGVPSAFSWQNGEGVQVTFTDDVTKEKKEVKVEEIVSIF